MRKSPTPMEILIYSIVIILALLWGFSSKAQIPPNYCPQNDSCWGAIEIPACTPIYYCNDSCLYEFYEATSEIDWPVGDPYMDNEVGPWNNECHYINYDQWFEFIYPDTADGYLTLDIWDGDCAHPEGASGNHGPLEGWTMMLWEGDSCDNNTNLVWSTNCYWMTEAEVDPSIGPDDWLGIDEYDPTRQDWHILITNAIPGQHYFVQLDSFGWCQGCGWFQWCHIPIFLGHENPPPPTIEQVEEEDTRVKPPWRVTNLLGQEVPIEYNRPLIFYYKNGDTRIVVITE